MDDPMFQIHCQGHTFYVPQSLAARSRYFSVLVRPDSLWSESISKQIKLSDDDLDPESLELILRHCAFLNIEEPKHLDQIYKGLHLPAALTALATAHALCEGNVMEGIIAGIDQASLLSDPDAPTHLENAAIQAKDYACSSLLSLVGNILLNHPHYIIRIDSAVRSHILTWKLCENPDPRIIRPSTLVGYLISSYHTPFPAMWDTAVSMLLRRFEDYMLWGDDYAVPHLGVLPKPIIESVLSNGLYHASPHFDRIAQRANGSGEGLLSALLETWVAESKTYWVSKDHPSQECICHVLSQSLGFECSPTSSSESLAESTWTSSYEQISQIHNHEDNHRRLGSKIRGVYMTVEEKVQRGWSPPLTSHDVLTTKPPRFRRTLRGFSHGDSSLASGSSSSHCHAMSGGDISLLLLCEGRVRCGVEAALPQIKTALRPGRARRSIGFDPQYHSCHRARRFSSSQSESSTSGPSMYEFSFSSISEPGSVGVEMPAADGSFAVWDLGDVHVLRSLTLVPLVVRQRSRSEGEPHADMKWFDSSTGNIGNPSSGHQGHSGHNVVASRGVNNLTVVALGASLEHRSIANLSSLVKQGLGLLSKSQSPSPQTSSPPGSRTRPTVSLEHGVYATATTCQSDGSLVVECWPRVETRFLLIGWEGAHSTSSVSFGSVELVISI